MAAAAHAATRTYSSGPVSVAIADAGTAEHSITVSDAGPVSSLDVALRIEHPRGGDLTITLTGPFGPVGHAGGAARYGARLRDRTRLPGQADAAQRRRYAARRRRFAVRRRRVRAGRAAAHVPRNSGARALDAPDGGRRRRRRGRAALLESLVDLSRDVVEHPRAGRGATAADLSFRESDGLYRDLRLRIVRRARTAYAARLRQVGCRRDACPGSRPVLPLLVRDLDADREPEILFAAYTGGAHCCTYSTVFRRDPRGRTYRPTFRWWGNVAFRLVDLDHDGRPELRSADDRFAYAFASYAGSVDPIQIWRFAHGRMVDVTRRFPALVAREAASLRRLYARERRRPEHEVRGILAAYVADELLLRRGAQGWALLEAARRRGDLGAPADARRYIAALRAFLRRTGYL